MARDFGSAESTEIVGILCVFPNFGTARMGQKTRHPAVAELFRGSIDNPAVLSYNMREALKGGAILENAGVLKRKVCKACAGFQKLIAL